MANENKERIPIGGEISTDKYGHMFIERKGPAEPEIRSFHWLKDAGKFMHLHWAWDHYDEAKGVEVYQLNGSTTGEVS